MPIVDPLKFDIRVRDRLLRKGQLNDAEVKKHLEALADLSDQLVELELKQPALQKESERAEYAPRISRPSPAIARPAPIRPFDEEDEIDDELPVPADDDDDEDDDLDDEDDEDEDEAEDKVEDKAEKTDDSAGDGDEEKADPEAKKDVVDDDWGSES